MKKLSVLALAALAMAMSCQKNENAQDPTPQPVMRTITCTIAEPDPASKVDINATDGKTIWKENDEILFHGKYTGEHDSKTYSVVVKLKAEDISADGKTFTATIPDFENGATQAKWEEYSSKSNIFAAYPASALTVDNANNNWYNKNVFNASNLPLMSGFNDGYDSNSFIFYNLTGILSFIVTGEIDSYTLIGNNSETVAYSTYTSRIFKKTDDSIKTDWVYNDKSPFVSTPVTSVSGTVTPGSETRIFIPNGVTFSGGFTIIFSNGGTPVKSLSTTKSVSIARNEYRPMGDITSYLEDYVAPSTSTHTYDSEVFTSVTNLGETQTANCYVIDAAGSYKFPVVKGNSSTSAGNIFDVKLLWETWNNNETVTENSVIAAVDFDGPSNYVYFKTPATLKPGNALIAAKDNLGNIIWSWHIWVPNGMFTTDTYGLGEKKMMSRNLGALVDAAGDPEANSDILSYGLMYQWGRKDPFPGSGANGSTGAAKTYPASIISNTGGVAKDMDYAIKNPNVFISTTSYKYDWNTTTDGTLWGDGGTKSINDPCPAGYRVPKKNWVSIFTAKGSSITGWALDKSHYWLKVGSPVTVFPITGYREEGGSIDHVTDRFFLWNSHHDSGYSTPEGKGYMMYYNDTDSSESSTGKCRGGVIRCVEE